MAAEIRVKGKTKAVPSIQVGDRTIIVMGKWIKVASIFEESLIEEEIVADPEIFITELRKGQPKADIFTFAQKLPDVEPKYRYHTEWDNAAAIPITSYEDWFRKRIGNDVRQNVRKSGKRGLVLNNVSFDDEFVRGIVDIYNETPIRQGRPFWHYGQDFDTVKKRTSHCVERSYFIGAYYRDELVGFIKLLRTGTVADIVLIVCKERHRDKKPTNALIAKAVELCVRERIDFLTYAQFFYQKKSFSSLAEFKRRNGFEPIRFPRYYVPLTQKGRLGIMLNLHHGIKGVVPESVLDILRNIRARFYRGGVTDSKLRPAFNDSGGATNARG